MSDNSFSQFTNLYSLSKTLRFELKPVGKTEQMLKEYRIFEIDENRKIAYENIKPFINKLHRDFIKDSLEDAKLEGLDIYFELFKKYRQDKNNNKFKSEIEKQRKKLRSQIISFFDRKGKEWALVKYSQFKIKKKDLNLLFEPEVFNILKSRYGNVEGTEIEDTETGEKYSIFDGWKGFNGYFTKFFETRKNFYKDNGTSTALATRMIDQNLDRFLENLILFDNIKDKLDINEIEESFDFESKDIFNIEFYNSCLLQNGIDKYNEFIGGKTLINGEKKKGVNEIINKYRQDNPGEKLPFLKKLDKQILSEKEKFIDEIESDEELFKVLQDFYSSAQTKTKIVRALFTEFFENIDKYSIEGIFLSKEAYNTISHKWTDQTDLFSENLYSILKSSKIVSTSSKKSDGTYSFLDFIALNHIKDTLDSIPADEKFWKSKYYDIGVLSIDDSTWEGFLKIFRFEFETLLRNEVLNSNTNLKEIRGFDVNIEHFRSLLADFKINTESKVVIKNFADSVLHIYQMAKYFALEKKRAWDTEYDSQLDRFYTDPDNGYLKFYENAYEEIIQPYNKVRNYITRKPYSEEKWKLNFDNPTLADGWDKNKERDNSAVVLRKEGKYYLAIMRKGKNDIFSDKNLESIQSENLNYEKLVYKLFPDPSKMMPKVCFSEKGREFFKPSSEIMRIYKNQEFKKGDTFKIDSMQKFIAFFIDCLSKYEGWKHYEFSYVRPANYYVNNIGEFYADVARSGYKIWFEKISENYINLNNEKGDLFLFQIYNKDFSNLSTGKKNLHTMYFNELFSENNINNNFPLKLNGQAEIFYRPKTDVNKLRTKKDNKGKEVVDHKRYSENKIFFHVPITLNRTPQGSSRFNSEVNNFLANNSDINIIGVDRGEKHLAYYSVIDQKGEILESGSLNIVNNIDYHGKLGERAGEREQARKDWQKIEGIKDLKKGYISQVVRKLADLAIKYNAIIVMEDLNMRFKQIRGGIEKSIYQQLEKALIEKLNYLVNKNEIDPNKAGHLLKAYQLTAPFTTFKEMGKQTGIIFYTQASYTSKTDPLTGWRPNIYLKYSNAIKAKEDILKFSDISFEGNRFDFKYDIKNFVYLKEYPNKTEWIVSSCVERFRWDRKQNNNKGGYIYYKNITNNFTELFSKFGIDKESNILNQIKNIDDTKKENAHFFKEFIFLFNLICQIRNTQQDKTGNDSDFILSPVEPFFDSRRANIFGNSLPTNGDDNGAYNIARKGVIILDKISGYFTKNRTVEDMKWSDLYVSNTDWDNFVTKADNK